MFSKRRTHEDYTIGWICALDIELTAARGMLDEEHDYCPLLGGQNHNVYTLGTIGEHNIAIACLPAGSNGKSAAATCAISLIRNFPHIRFGFIVGIGGGAPSLHK